MTEWMTTREVAERLRISEKTVVAWRYQRRGPRFYKLGPRTVRYRREDIEAFARSMPVGTLDQPPADPE